MQPLKMRVNGSVANFTHSRGAPSHASGYAASASHWPAGGRTGCPSWARCPYLTMCISAIPARVRGDVQHAVNPCRGRLTRLAVRPPLSPLQTGLVKLPARAQGRVRRRHACASPGGSCADPTRDRRVIHGHPACLPHRCPLARTQRVGEGPAPERKVQTSEMLLQLAMIRLMVRRLARSIG